jgi:DNA uptake protein ComE-like DNA-binding protein
VLAWCLASVLPAAFAAGDPAKPPAAPPSTAAPVPTPSGQGSTAARKSEAAKPEKKVDLNNATKAELMKLPSVGEAEAVKIIANRPYISKVDLVTKAGLPEGLYVAVKNKVVVNDMKKPAAKKTEPKK